MTKGEEITSRALMIPFFGDSCQRGREYEPKAKGPHHHQFKNLVFQRIIFQLVSHCVQKGEKVVFQK